MAATFQDTAGRDWVLEITVGTVKDLRQRADVDLLKILDDQAALLGRLAGDLILLVDCLWIVVEKQAEAAEVSPEDFAASLGGDTLADAAAAFWEAIADFFPDPAARRAMKAVIEKASEAGRMLSEATIREIEGMDLSSILKDAGISVTSSPELSGSTP